MSRKFFPRARRADTNNGKVDWQAKWIWCEGEPSPKNFYLYARRVFDLPNNPERAILRCTADSRYELYINSQYVGRGPVRSDPRYQTYDTYDITSFLVRGKNVIGMLVHHYGESTYSYVLGRGGFICQVEIEHAGETTILGTDENWKVYQRGPWMSSGARMSSKLGYQEVYDARLDLGAWTAVKYNDKNWNAPKVLGTPPVPPWENLIPRAIAHLREEQVLPAGVVTAAAIPPDPVEPETKNVPALMAAEEFLPVKKGDISGETEIAIPNGHGIKLKGARSGGKVLLIDFGREVSGRVRLDISGYSGGVVDIGYSEKLENGRIDPSRGEVLYSDRLIMRAGRYTWTGFESRGFRYLQLDFRNLKRRVHIHSVSVIETLYPSELKGRFESSDEMLNRIWAVGAETARLCMEDAFTNCPWRERGQWWADARIQSHAAYYAFGDTALLAQGLRHVARTQRRDGALMCMYPVPGTKIVPDFAALWVMSVWDYYAFSGDRGMLFDLYSTVSRLLHWLNGFTDHDGLLANVEGWNFIDWGSVDTEGEVTALNCLYYKALRRGEHMALMLSKGADADRWNGMASILRIAINKHLWSPSRGLYADSRVNGRLKDNFSRQTNILAVLYDVPDHYRKSSICRHLLNSGLPQITTPYFMGYFTDALFRIGYDEEAIDLIRRRWGAMIEEGATTFWEHFTPTGSLCHGWSVSPTRDLSAYVLGVQPVPGKRRVRVEPHTGKLNWAKGTVPTPYGNVEVEWRKNRRDFVLTLRLPSGLSGLLDLPMVRTGARVTINGKEREGSAFDLGPGTYNVRVKYVSVSTKSRETIMDRNARENVVEYLSDHQIWRSQERRPRRAGPVEVVDTESEEEELISDEEIEYVEGLDEVHPSAYAAAEKTEEKKKSSRSRRRRSRTKEEEPEEIRETAPAEEQAEALEAAETAGVSEEPVKRRTRRGRRARGRERSAEQAVTEAAETVTVEVVEAEVEHAPAIDIEELHAINVKMRPKRQGGRGRRSAAESTAPPAPSEVEVVQEKVEPAPEPEAEAPVEQASEKPAKRSSRRGNRGRRRAAQEPEISEQAEAQPVVEQPAPAVDQQVEVEPTAPQAKPRRSRGRRRSAAVDESVPADAEPAVDVQEPVTVEAAAVVEPETSAPKQRRQYRRRRTPKRDSAESLESGE